MYNEVLNLTKKLINIPSISPNDFGCQDILIKRLVACGFTIELINFQDTNNFWAYRGSGKTVTFAGHTDVVIPGLLEKWIFPPFSASIKQNYLYGRGASDMKGALAAMCIATEQFISEYPKHVGRLSFLITSDEESSGKYGTKYVVNKLKKRNEIIDYCILGEPTSEKLLGDCIKNGRRGSICAHLTIQGVQGHVAYPLSAKNPIFQVAKFIQDLQNLSLDKKNNALPASTIQITHISSGTKTDNNVIPGILKLIFNIRFNAFLNIETIKKKILELLQKNNLNYSIKWKLNAMPFLVSSNFLIEKISKSILKYTNINTTVKVTGGTSDGRYLQKISKEIIEFGLCNYSIHKINEHVKISELFTLSKIYKNLLIELFI